MSELGPEIAKRIIASVGGPGEPPQYGFQYFSAGLDPYLSVIDEEYLASFIRQGGSSFKMVVGVYGGGKTHFLYSVRDLAWKHDFVVSYVSLSPKESPFHKLELVYGAIVRGMMQPLAPEELLSGYEQGIRSFLRAWYAQRYRALAGQGFSEEALREELAREIEDIEGIESISFAKAIRSACSALMNHRDDDFQTICQWLGGEGYDSRAHRQYGILQRIDKTTAFAMLRSLSQWVRKIGYSGLVVLLDEAERVPSLSTKQRDQHLGNLREVIDECGRTSFQGVMILYAVPDENFLEGRTQTYEALRQRVATVFEMLNPSGVKIELERVVGEPIDFLTEVGMKLAKVYEMGYGHWFDEAKLRHTVATVAAASYEQRFGDIGYKRLFVQMLVRGLHFLRHEGEPPSADDLEM